MKLPRTIDPLWIAVLCSILFSAVFYAVTMRNYPVWEVDGPIYIRHGINLARGLPYGHLNMPELTTGRTYAYPVGLPLILAGVYLIFGLNFPAFVWVITCFLFAFVAIFALVAVRFRVASPVMLVLLSGLFALNPYVRELAQQVFADLPFIVFAFLSLYWYDKSVPWLGGAGHTDRAIFMARSPSMIVFWCLSLSLVAAYAMRTMAVILPLSILTFELLRFRKIHWWTLGVMVPLAIFAVAHEYLFGTIIGYAHEISHYLDLKTPDGATPVLWQYGTRAIDRVVGSFRWALADFFSLGLPAIVGSAVAYGLVAIPAAIGYFHRLVFQFSVWEVFGPAYLATLLVSHVPPYPRYLLPILALILLYAVVGVSVVASVLKNRIAGPVFMIGLSVVLLTGYAAEYVKSEIFHTDQHNNRPEQGVAARPAQELFAWIRSNTGSDDFLAAQKADYIGLMTWRRIGKIGWCRMRVGCHFLERQDRVWQYFRQQRVKYLILMTADHGIESYRPDNFVAEGIVAPHRENFRLAYKNSAFEVFEFVRYLE